jgi:hypothetical protein
MSTAESNANSNKRQIYFNFGSLSSTFIISISKHQYVTA